MKIYLAAQFKEQELMKQWRNLLHNSNHLVTSRWLDERPGRLPLEAALIDLDDIDNAEYVFSKTLSRGDLYTGGGRHIEFGYAFARGKALINIGGIESVFHHLPEVITVPTIEEAIECLTKL